jgi:hypothetical protein
MKRSLVGVAVVIGAFAAQAAAKPKPTATASVIPTPTSSPTASPAPTSSLGTVTGCVETLPPGAQRPTLTESFPTHGLSGYAAILSVTVDHGRGETVLPHGLELQSESESAKALKSAGFVLPDQDGGAPARLIVNPADPKHADRASTTLELPLLALPPEPGRHTLTVPPLPVAIARASGEIGTACTKPHTITIEDPTASTPDAQPKPNPPPRRQREEWTSMRHLVTYAAIGILIGAVLAFLVRKWMQRPRPVAPPPPPRPPWEVAFEKLDEVRHAGLLEVGRFQEYFDRVNDAVRAYLGARYDFDGLESTSDEILSSLSHANVGDLAMPGVVDFLTECDLVKFANMTPSQAACERALDSAERIVRTTMPQRGTPFAVPTLGEAPATPAAQAPPATEQPPNPEERP